MPPPHVPPQCFQTPCGNIYIDIGIDRERAPPPPLTLFSREREMLGLQVYKKVTDPFTESVRAKIIAHSPNYGTYKHPSSFTFPQEEEEELHMCVCGHLRCNCALNCTKNNEEEEGEASSTHAWNLHEITQSVGSLCIPEDPTLLRHVSMALEAAPCHKVGEEPFSVHPHIVKHLHALGYNAALCKSHWAHNSSISLAAGSYEYIDVVLASGKKERVIVDVNFRSEFQIARAEEQYRVLLEALPLVFVGRLQNLKQVVKLMCQAAEQSLRRQGLEVPPWRKCQYMQHKWQSSYRRTTREVTHSKNDVRTIAPSSTHVISKFSIHLEQALSFYHTNTNINTIPTPTCRKERPLGGLSRALLLQSDAC